MNSRRINKLMIQEITERFYSHFCGTDISKLNRGIYFVCSADRDAELKGFGRKYTIFIYVKEELCIISYSPKYKAYFETLKKCNVNNLVERVNKNFNMKKKQLMIFNDEIVTQYGDAKILSKEDYPLYESFFRTIKPNVNPNGWLHEYFFEKSAKKYFVGYLKNGKLVSVCDTPDMPYMQDKIQHTGIETLVEERKKGYAKCVTALATHNMLENGICPQWECDINNKPSINLAKSIGYKEYGVAYILEE